jgi:2-polyprenyl-6-methoxyphenol hydroxylase-like FAD-dependent oxidoreductase
VQPGVVLIGDAFHAPCPASGTGMTRILNDVERLAGTHLPQWLATPGMGEDKIKAFYADPLKVAVDKASVTTSMMGRRSALDPSLLWRVRRTLGRLRRRIANALAEAKFRSRSAAAPQSHGAN